jgi:hypothetical protein
MPIVSSQRQVKQGLSAHASIAAVWAMTLLLALNPRTKTESNKIERSISMPEIWLARIKEDAVDVAAEAADVADVADEAVAVAVVGAVVEGDLISPLPSPKKITNEASLGNRTHTIRAPSVGMHRHKELWLFPSKKKPPTPVLHTPHTSSKAIRTTMTERKL